MLEKYYKRELSEFIDSDAWPRDVMLFVAGPRQCGKTSLAKAYLCDRGCSSLYYNWDIEKTRRTYRRDPDFFAKDASRLDIQRPVAVFDEIHKMARWRNILKGAYDAYNEDFSFIVTGSARLDLLRRGGDSLVGRYVLAHLFPFSLREWTETHPFFPWLHEEGDWIHPEKSFCEKLIATYAMPVDLVDAYRRFGPFPAPLIAGSERRSRTWHRDYLSLLVREDLRDLSGIREIDRVSHLVELLPERIGSPLSLRSLSEDLEASHSTIQVWLSALQKLYLVWPISPFSKKIHRAMKKEKKWYFLDWTYAGRDSSRFENMVGTELLRFVTSLHDAGWPEVGLDYLRTYDKKEIDFILTLKNQPILAVECKMRSRGFSSILHRFRKEWSGNDFPIVQVVGEEGILLEKDKNAFVAGFDRFFMAL